MRQTKTSKKINDVDITYFSFKRNRTIQEAIHNKHIDCIRDLRTQEKIIQLIHKHGGYLNMSVVKEAYFDMYDTALEYSKLVSLIN